MWIPFLFFSVAVGNLSDFTATKARGWPFFFRLYVVVKLTLVVALRFLSFPLRAPAIYGKVDRQTAEALDVEDFLNFS